MKNRNKKYYLKIAFCLYCSIEEQNIALWKSICSWCYVFVSDQSLMVDPLSYVLFQPVLHHWCNKGCGMCYPPVCGMMHIKEPLP